MPKFLRFAALAATFTTVAITATGCSNLEFPGVYKIPIEQGNIVTQDMVDELKPGMSREQVEFIMGTPLLKDTFHPNRWDYIYSIEKDPEPRKQYRISVFFEHDRLKSFTGDIPPSSVRDAGENNTAGQEQDQEPTPDLDQDNDG